MARRGFSSNLNSEAAQQCDPSSCASQAWRRIRGRDFSESIGGPDYAHLGHARGHAGRGRSCTSTAPRRRPRERFELEFARSGGVAGLTRRSLPDGFERVQFYRSENRRRSGTYAAGSDARAREISLPRMGATLADDLEPHYSSLPAAASRDSYVGVAENRGTGKPARHSG